MVAPTFHRLILAFLNRRRGFVAAALHKFPERTLRSVHIVDNLHDYTMQHANELNTAEGFSKRDLMYGDLDSKAGTISNTPLIFDFVAYCNADLRGHAKEGAKFINDLEPNGKDPATEAGLIKALEAEKGPGICLVKHSDQWPDTQHFVAYKWTRTALALSWLLALAKGIAAAGIAWFIAANVYYRGFIYIVFGRRRRAEESSSV
jgi:hypothetical protein